MSIFYYREQKEEATGLMREAKLKKEIEELNHKLGEAHSKWRIAENIISGKNDVLKRIKEIVTREVEE